MKITFFELEPWQKDLLKTKLQKHKLNFVDEDLSIKNVSKAKDSEIICIFIYSEVNKQILDKLPKLKAVITMSTGFDHIDVKECNRNNIRVLNVPFYGANTVAEHTFALILSLSRKIPQSYDRTKNANFNLDGLRGFDLKGKTIGIVGLGHIGQHVAKMANGFDMKILALDHKKDATIAKQYKIKFTNLDTILKNSDVITLHLPYIPSTHHILNSKNIPLIKKGAILVNTARGSLIDTTALLKALQRKQLSGLGLDVLEEEEIIKDEKKILTRKLKNEQISQLLENHALLSYENVIITPHNAFNSQEALERILNTTIENINSIIKGKPINLVEIRG